MGTTTAAKPQTRQEAGLAELAGKYLTFELGGEQYGLEILSVQELIGIMQVTPVPKTPAFVRGVINLRGKVIPVVDLRQKFGLPVAQDTERTCIIVVQVKYHGRRITMGIVVDEVSEVLEIAIDQLEARPEFGVQLESDFILAMGKIGDRVVMLLEIDRVLSGREVAAVNKIGDAEGRETAA